MKWLLDTFFANSFNVISSDDEEERRLQHHPNHSQSWLTVVMEERRSPSPSVLKLGYEKDEEETGLFSHLQREIASKESFLCLLWCFLSLWHSEFVTKIQWNVIPFFIEVYTRRTEWTRFKLLLLSICVARLCSSTATALISKTMDFYLLISLLSIWMSREYCGSRDKKGEARGSWIEKTKKQAWKTTRVACLSSSFLNFPLSSLAHVFWVSLLYSAVDSIDSLQVMSSIWCSFVSIS